MDLIKGATAFCRRMTCKAFIADNLIAAIIKSELEYSGIYKTSDKKETKIYVPEVKDISIHLQISYKNPKNS